MAEWKIRRRHGECSRCEANFEESARFASLLRLDEDEDLLREDLCVSCWQGSDQDTFLFWWFTRYHESRKQTVQLDLASLETLFMQLEGREEEKLRELRYLLCLLLMRKRKVKLIKVQRGKDGERLILRRPRRTEELTVWVYDFTPDRIEELRARLQEVLDGAGPTEEGQSAPDETPAAEPEDAEPEAIEAGVGEGPSPTESLDETASA